MLRLIAFGKFKLNLGIYAMMVVMNPMEKNKPGNDLDEVFRLFPCSNRLFQCSIGWGEDHESDEGGGGLKLTNRLR